MADPDQVAALAKAVPPEVIRDAYRDLAAPPLQQFGRFGEDFVKALRLALFPIQLLSAVQDRVEAYLNRAIRQVPEDRIVTPMESVFLPVVEKLRFQEEGNIITELYINLLSRAMDGERVSEAHPAFVGLIAQLAPDEVLFLRELAKHEYTLIIRLDEEWTTPSAENVTFVYERLSFTEQLIERSSEIIFDYFSLNQPELFYVFLEHLSHIGLIEYTNDPTDNNREYHHIQVFLAYPRVFFIKLTSFGKMFYNACVPQGKAVVS
jgi:hypothetical protein